MRIPSKISSADQAARSGRTTKVGAKKAGKAKTGGGAGVRASVSARARSLAQDGGIDAAKVERLRDLIERGEFTIDYNLVAEQILQRG